MKAHVRRLNLAHRHLNQEQRRLIEDHWRENPQQSNAQIADVLGVDDKTVALSFMA
jgi:hypothetical protein